MFSFLFCIFFNQDFEKWVGFEGWVTGLGLHTRNPFEMGLHIPISNKEIVIRKLSKFNSKFINVFLQTLAYL